jgi:hypothetical protein
VKEPAKESASTANAQEGPTPTEAEDAAKGDERVDAEKPAAKETAEERSPEAELLSCASPESELYVDAPTPGEPVADEQAEEKADDDDDKRTIVEELDSAVEKAVVNGVLTEEPIHVNGVQQEEEEEQMVDAEEERQEEEEQTKKEKEEKSRVAYVGDATWEEKTWKEIVRLREDMFWARMGGIRE